MARDIIQHALSEILRLSDRNQMLADTVLRQNKEIAALTNELNKLKNEDKADSTANS